MTFNMPADWKLVRDRIPEIILSGDKFVCSFQTLAKQDIPIYLRKKLIEEATEVSNTFDDDHLVEELADVMEVVMAIASASNFGITMEQIEKARQKKLRKRGGFKRGIIFKGTEC